MHTKRLGPLNARASRRLTVVTNGVVQQYFEAQTEIQGDDFEMLNALTTLMEAVKTGKMPREAALEKFNTMQEKLWEQRDAYIRSGKARVYDLIDHPLYQQVIKDVLSEEAFAQYLAHQAEREILRQQAFRDLVVALMDIQLLLNDGQRKQLETMVLLFPITSLSYEGFAITLVEFYLRIDPEMWGTWQRVEWER